MKLKNWIFGLFVALGTMLITVGPAFAGPTYIHTNHPAVDLGMACGLDQKISSTDYKYACYNENFIFSLWLSSFIASPTMVAKGCDLKGQNWRSGLFNQNWHHALRIDVNSGACTLSQLNENTWVLKVKID